MPIEHETREDVLILRPTLRLDSNTAPELEKILMDALDSGTGKVVFDFAALDYISSAGLRIVLLAGKRLRVPKGKLALSGLTPSVKEVFEMSGFLALFQIFDTLAEATQAMAT